MNQTKFKNISFKKVAAAVAICLTTACAKTGSRDYAAENNLKRLSKLGAFELVQDKAISPLRAEMLREAALSVGARSGLSHRSYQINQIVMKYDKGLSRVFNFNGLLVSGNVLPPILIEADNTLKLEDNITIRTSDRTYEIIEQARFVTATPTWRNYLITNFNKPEDPSPGLLPKTPGERIIWRKYIASGWKAGIKQAESIYSENVARLIRDYKGMVKYHDLLKKNMVTPPYVAGIDLGITGDESKVNIRDQVLRITALPEINADSKYWKTLVRKNE